MGLLREDINTYLNQIPTNNTLLITLNYYKTVDQRLLEALFKLEDGVKDNLKKELVYLLKTSDVVYDPFFTISSYGGLNLTLIRPPLVPAQDKVFIDKTAVALVCSSIASSSSPYGFSSAIKKEEAISTWKSNEEDPRMFKQCEAIYDALFPTYCKAGDKTFDYYLNNNPATWADAMAEVASTAQFTTMVFSASDKSEADWMKQLWLILYALKKLDPTLNAYNKVLPAWKKADPEKNFETLLKNFVYFQKINFQQDEFITEVNAAINEITDVPARAIRFPRGPGGGGEIDTLPPQNIYGEEVVTFIKTKAKEFYNNSEINNITYPSKTSSCFTKDTPILLQDGSSLPIHKISQGHQVLSKDGLISIQTDEKVVLPLRQDMPIFGFNEEMPFFTKGHPFWTSSGWKALDPAIAQEENPSLEVSPLQVGDSVFQVESVAPYKLRPVQIKNITHGLLKAGESVYGLHLIEGPHAYFANGYLVKMNYPMITAKRLSDGFAKITHSEKELVQKQLLPIMPLLKKVLGNFIEEPLLNALQSTQQVSSKEVLLQPFLNKEKIFMKGKSLTQSMYDKHQIISRSFDYTSPRHYVLHYFNIKEYQYEKFSELNTLYFDSKNLVLASEKHQVIIENYTLKNNELKWRHEEDGLYTAGKINFTHGGWAFTGSLFLGTDSQNIQTHDIAGTLPPQIYTTQVSQETYTDKPAILQPTDEKYPKTWQKGISLKLEYVIEDDNQPRMKISAQNNGCDLCLMLESIKNNYELAEESKLYIEANGNYISRHNGKIYSGSLLVGEFSDPSINFEQLSIKILDSDFKNKILDVTSKRGHTKNYFVTWEDPDPVYHEALEEGNYVIYFPAQADIADFVERFGALWPADGKLTFTFDANGFNGYFKIYDNETKKLSDNYFYWLGKHSNPTEILTFKADKRLYSANALLPQRMLTITNNLSVEDLLISVPDEGSVRELSNNMLIQNMKWALGEKHSDWLSNFFGENQPVLDQPRIADIRPSLDFYTDTFAVAYLSSSLTKIAKEKGGATNPLTIEEQGKLNEYFKTGVSKNEDFNKQSLLIHRRAYIQASTKLEQYISNEPKEWAKKLFNTITTPQKMLVTVGSLQNNPIGTMKQINTYATLLAVLDPTGNFTQQYYVKLQACHGLDMWKDALCADKKLIEQWIKDFLNTLLSGSIPVKIDEAMKQFIAEVKALQMEAVKAGIDLADVVAEFIISTINASGVFQRIIIGDITGPVANFLTRYPKLVSMASHFISLVKVCAFGFGLTEVIQGFKNWSELSDIEKGRAIVTSISLLTSLVKAVPSLVDGTRRVYSWRERRIINNFIRANAAEDAQALEIASGILNNPNGEAQLNIVNAVEESGEIAQAWSARFANTIQRPLKAFGFLASAAFAGLSIAAFIQDFTGHASVIQKAFDGIIMSSMILETVFTGLDILSLEIAGAAAFGPAAVLFAVVGAIAALVELFIPRPKPESPLDKFMDEYARPFVGKLPSLVKPNHLANHLVEFSFKIPVGKPVTGTYYLVGDFNQWLKATPENKGIIAPLPIDKEKWALTLSKADDTLLSKSISLPKGEYHFKVVSYDEASQETHWFPNEQYSPDYKNDLKFTLPLPPLSKNKILIPNAN